MSNISPFIFCVLFFSLRYPLHAQVNWVSSQNVASATYSNRHPRVATNSAGEAIVIWTRGSDESLFASKWNGSSFNTPVKLNAGITVAGASWMGPDIASKGDTIYVVMKETPEADTGSHIYLVRSFDGGMNFSTPIQVDQIQDSVSRFPTITTDDNGQPIIAFMKFNSSFGDSRWVVTRSNNYGSSFQTDVKASGWGNSAEVCDCCPGAIVCKGSDVAMLYRDNNNNQRDTWMGVSHNGGLSFTTGCNIDNNNWNLMMCPSTGPDGIILNDSVFSTFCSGGSGVNRNYCSASSLSQTSAGWINNLSSGIMSLTQQNYPRISSFGNAVALVWEQTVNGVKQLPLLFTQDYTQGFPVIWDTVDVNDITNTDVVLAQGKMFIVWQDDNSGTVKCRVGAFTLSGVTELAANSDVNLYPNPVDDHLMLQLAHPITNSTVSIYSLLGKELKKIKMGSTNEMRIQVDDLVPGHYLIKVADEQGYRYKRWVKL